MRQTIILFVLLSLTAIIVACGGERLTDCQDEFRRAAEASDMGDDVDALDTAVFACASVDEWTAAAAQFPAALDGVDPVTFLRNRCQYGGVQLSARAICKEAVGE